MISKTILQGDWKGEKHVPVIDINKKEKFFEVEVSVGKEIPHPNTVEHHIAWIELYFLPDGGKFPVQIGRTDFFAHSEPVVEPVAKFIFKTDKKGKLLALSYCNIHGLWESELSI